MRIPIDVHFNLTVKKALFTPNAFQAKRHGLSTTEPTEVGVFGLFQVKEDDEIDAYFVVKLPDGHCCYASVTDIQFIKKEADEDEAPDRD